MTISIQHLNLDQDKENMYPQAQEKTLPIYLLVSTDEGTRGLCPVCGLSRRNLFEIRNVD